MSEKDMRNPEKVDTPSNAELYPKPQPTVSPETVAALGSVALKSAGVEKP